LTVVHSSPMMIVDLDKIFNTQPKRKKQSDWIRQLGREQVAQYDRLIEIKFMGRKP